MARLPSLLLAVSLLAGCGSSGSDEPAAEPEPEAPQEEDYLPETSTMKIGDALKAGEIDLQRATLLHLYAQFSPERLPAAFLTDAPTYGPVDTTWALRALRTIDSYSPEEQQDIRAMLSPPDSPDFGNFGSRALRGAGETKPTCRQSFMVGSESLTIGTPIDTQYFRFKTMIPVKEGVDRQLEVRERLAKALAAPVKNIPGRTPAELPLGDYFDRVFELFLSKGFNDPRDTFTTDEMNDGRIPIYVVTCDGDRNDAAAVNGWAFVSVGVGLEDPNFRRVVVPHEIFHLVQETYVGFDPRPEHAWPFEASAVAIEDWIAPDVRRWAGHLPVSDTSPAQFARNPMNRSFRCPEEPFHSMFEGMCKYRWNTPAQAGKAYLGSYSKFAFFKYMEAKHGLDLADFWRRYGEAEGDPTGIIEPYQIHGFQVALLADVKGETPSFSAADRAEFYKRSAKVNLDVAPSNFTRYTFKLEEKHLKNNKGRRVAPTEQVFENAYRMFDANKAPLAPGATHRWLIELPPSTSEGDFDKLLALTWEAQAAAEKLSITIVPLDGKPGAPGKVIDTASDFSIVWDYPLSAKQREHFPFFAEGPGVALPRLFLAVLTNFGKESINYRVGVAQPLECTRDCVSTYSKRLNSLGCPERWCASGDDPGDPACISGWRDWLPELLETGAAGLGWGFCQFVCDPANPEQPYPDTKQDHPGGDWSQLVCDGGGLSRGQCREMPAGFVPWKDDLPLRCEDVVR